MSNTLDSFVIWLLNNLLDKGLARLADAGALAKFWYRLTLS